MIHTKFNFSQLTPTACIKTTVHSNLLAQHCMQHTKTSTCTPVNCHAECKILPYIIESFPSLLGFTYCVHGHSKQPWLHQHPQQPHQEVHSHGADSLTPSVQSLQQLQCAHLLIYQNLDELSRYGFLLKSQNTCTCGCGQWETGQDIIFW